MSAPVLISGGEAGDPEFNDPLLPHLLDAIARCGEGSRIELCVSFIRQSGLVLLRGALHEVLARGARLRVITSDYLEVTQPVALRELLEREAVDTMQATPVTWRLLLEAGWRGGPPV